MMGRASVGNAQAVVCGCTLPVRSRFTLEGRSVEVSAKKASSRCTQPRGSRWYPVAKERFNWPAAIWFAIPMFLLGVTTHLLGVPFWVAAIAAAIMGATYPPSPWRS